MFRKTWAALAVPAVASATVAVGCNDKGDDSGGDVAIDVELTDPNNYSYTGLLALEPVQVASNTDVTFNWPALSKDMQCHDVDPVADIDNAQLMVFPSLSEEELEIGLSEDSLQQVDLGVYLSDLTGTATTKNLTDLTFFGTDPMLLEKGLFSEASGQWLFLLATGEEVGVGTRALVLIHPVDGEKNSTVDITDEEQCGVLDFSADITSLTQPAIGKDGNWVVDWSRITQSAIGGAFDSGKIDSLMVGRYSQYTVEELQAQFLDLELIADELYTLDLLGGTNADLADASGPAGSFPGFDQDGPWLFALRCGTCPNPAPPVLTVLSPQ